MRGGVAGVEGNRAIELALPSRAVVVEAGEDFPQRGVRLGERPVQARRAFGRGLRLRLDLPRRLVVVVGERFVAVGEAAPRQCGARIEIDGALELVERAPQVFRRAL